MKLLYETKGNIIPKKLCVVFVVIMIVMVISGVSCFALRGLKNNSSKPQDHYSESDHTYHAYYSSADIYGEYLYGEDERQTLLYMGIGSILIGFVFFDLLTVPTKTTVKIYEDHLEGIGFIQNKRGQFYLNYNMISEISEDREVPRIMPVITFLAAGKKYSFATKDIKKCLELIHSGTAF